MALFSIPFRQIPSPTRCALPSIVRWLTGGALALLTLLTIVTGLKGVARLMQWLVPLMALLWVSTSLMVCAIHIDEVPNVIVTIFQSAFGWREAASGALGYTLSRTHCGFSAGYVLQRSGNGLHAECRRSGRILAPTSRRAGHCTDDWRLHRHHCYLLRQRDDNAAGRCR